MITRPAPPRAGAMLLLAAAVCLPPVGGCSQRVLRETVFANTETMLGITVAQNVKNQMYEARVGYVRHELFLVPTSKFVKYTKQGDTLLEAPEGDSINDPSKTPEVLGEIMVDGKIPVQGGQTLAFGLRQKLAVGPLAVQAPGAVALMADTPDEASSAAMMKSGLTTAQRIRVWLYSDDETRAQKVKELEAWINERMELKEEKMTVVKWLRVANEDEHRAAIKYFKIPEIP